jgi:hypothetical protein
MDEETGLSPAHAAALKELRILRKAARQYGWCGLPRQREHGWENVLLRDALRERYRAEGLEWKEAPDEAKPA